jgi:succinate dehydrogenase hydrophobic anchor subunit
MILFTILILIIFITAMKIDLVSDWYKRIITQPYNYYVLLGLLIIGFLHNWIIQTDGDA